MHETPFDLRQIATLIAGLVGGWAFATAGVPLPWLLGSMVFVSVLSMSGIRLRLAPAVRTPMLTIVGVMLGSSFTPQILASVPGWSATILSLPVYVFLITGTSYGFLRLFTKLDKTTAFYASCPGGLGEIVLLSEASGADVRRVSLLHTFRILLIVFTIPFFIKLLGYDWENTTAQQHAGLTLTDALLLTACAPLGLWLGKLLRLPAKALIGSMIVSSIVHLTGLTSGYPPGWLVAAAQVVIGSAIGVRFGGFSFREVAETLFIGAGVVAVMLIASTLFAILFALFMEFDVAQLVLAFTPGGVAEMSLIALAMQIDTPFVVAHHAIRIFIVVLMAPFVFRYLIRSK